MLSIPIDASNSLTFSFELPEGVTVTSLLGFGATQTEPPPPPPGTAPAPDTWWLLAAGLLGLAGSRFRRAR